MLVKEIRSKTLGFDKGSYIEVEHLDGKIQKISLKRDKKRFNDGNLENQYYLLKEGNRVYVNEISLSWGEKMKIGIEIDGVIYAENGNISHKEFLDKFFEFVESNGWYFGGATRLIDENGDAINKVKR